MKPGGLRVSVRGLIEYALRSGSIGFDYQSSGGMARAREGVVFHQRLQKKREMEALVNGWEYEKEAAFCRTFSSCGIELTVRGRADGILKKDGKVYIEEIKTTEAPAEDIKENELHIAQAKCYAYFYAIENGITEIYVLLSYLSVGSAEKKEFEYRFSIEELKYFFGTVLEKYAKWAAFILERRDIRDKSALALEFPYEGYRNLQRDMCVYVYRAIERKKPIFISAPTGIGKTVSALFPAIKSLPSGKAEKIFYLTAKTITRTAALDAVCLMESKGLRAKTVVITAKDKACFLDKAVCDASACAYANGHFDRINEALYDILSNEDIISREVLLSCAERHIVCPYEMSLDIALYSDIIICDYNYAFDPRVYLRRFFAETNEDYIFLIDEAHNLVDRAREMYSAEISFKGLKAKAALIGKSGKVLKKIIKNIANALSEMSEKINGDDYGLTMDEPPKSLINGIREYCREADKWLAENKAAKREGFYEALLELYFDLNHFLSICEIFDEKFICCCEKEYNDIRFKLFCMDPSGQMEIMLSNAASAVFFSATLTPLSYFKRLLGAKETDYAVTLPSPFPEENLGVIAVAGVSAKYKDRERYYGDIADYINAAIGTKNGNYFAFFPSYAYMESVYSIFTEKYPDIETSIQTPEMPETEKERFLERFIEQEEKAFVCFAVLGGMFSEGIDLPGKRLIGAFIISVGLPKTSFERLLISNFFGEGDGFEYSYIYPGMNRVLQAGGRVIRTMSDKGIIILIDERFTYKSYNSLFPESWKGFKTVKGMKAFLEEVSGFWAME